MTYSTIVDLLGSGNYHLTPEEPDLTMICTPVYYSTTNHCETCPLVNGENCTLVLNNKLIQTYLPLLEKQYPEYFI